MTIGPLVLTTAESMGGLCPQLTIDPTGDVLCILVEPGKVVP